MTDDRVQTWRERMPIVAKMVDQAFNGDAGQDAEHVRFALMIVCDNGAVSMIKNVCDGQMISAFLSIIAQTMSDDDDDEQVAGHA